MSSHQEPRDDPSSPYSVSLDDLEAGVHVAKEDQVTEQDTEAPTLPSEAESRRAAEMRVITHGA